MFSQASPAKFCVSIVFNFSWDGCNTPEKRKNEKTKRKTKVMQRLAGGGGWPKTLFDGQSIYNIKTPVYILELCQEIG